MLICTYTYTNICTHIHTYVPTLDTNYIYTKVLNDYHILDINYIYTRAFSDYHIRTRTSSTRTKVCLTTMVGSYLLTLDICGPVEVGESLQTAMSAMHTWIWFQARKLERRVSASLAANSYTAQCSQIPGIQYWNVNHLTKITSKFKDTKRIYGW